MMGKTELSPKAETVGIFSNAVSSISAVISRHLSEGSCKTFVRFEHSLADPCQAERRQLASLTQILAKNFYIN